MSFRTEWMEAAVFSSEVTQDFKDAYGNTPDPGNYVLLIGGDDLTAIEGTLDELEAACHQMLNEVAKAREGRST